MTSKTFHLVSLGCAKNTVDSESMGQLLNHSGYQWTSNPDEADILIVNTCGFIASARMESIEVLNELAANKQEHQVLIAAGCLSQRYGAEVVKQVPRVDGVLGTRRWMDIVDVVNELREGNHPKPLYHLPNTPFVSADERGIPRISVQGSSAYLKIADGCRRGCAFCAIPLIKGNKPVSRPINAILKDARRLQADGIREIILIAQDTTDYGYDLGLKDGLSILLDALVDAVPDIDWIRILYAFPGYVTDRLIEIMATYPQVVHYLDIPLQHAAPKVLKMMRRPANMDWVYRTLEKMRKAIPDLALRTTFIVGYPGETEKEFQELLSFIEEIEFDKVGAFQFSFEKGTASEVLGDPVPPAVKQERYDRLMTLQQGISLKKNQEFIGKSLKVLVEGKGEGITLGRSYRDAPEIDGYIIVENDNLPLGEMVNVRINGAMPYDLSGIWEE